MNMDKRHPEYQYLDLLQEILDTGVDVYKRQVVAHALHLRVHTLHARRRIRAIHGGKRVHNALGVGGGARPQVFFGFSFTVLRGWLRRNARGQGRPPADEQEDDEGRGERVRFHE